MTWALITDFSEAYLQPLLTNILNQMKDDENLVIVDNRSEDETVPIIVGLIGEDFQDEERYKFYINSHRKSKKESEEVARAVNTKEHICFINRKKIGSKHLEKKREEILNATI